MIPQILFSLLIITCLVGIAYADSFGDSSFSSGSSFGDSSFGGSSFDYGGSSFGSNSFGGSSFDYGGGSFGSNSFGSNSFNNPSAPSWDKGTSWVQDGKEQLYNIKGVTKEGFTKEQVYEKAQFNNRYGNTFYQIHYGYPIYYHYWGYGGWYYGHNDFWWNWYMFTLILNQQEANHQRQLEQMAIDNSTNVHYDTSNHKYYEN